MPRAISHAVTMSFGSQMHVRDFLLPRHVLTDLRATDKVGLLRELSRRAGAALNIPSEILSAALLKREQLGSTGMSNGIAIPHACVAEVKEPFGVMVRLKNRSTSKPSTSNLSISSSCCWYLSPLRAGRLTFSQAWRAS
jgi:hypothetical protein